MIVVQNLSKLYRIGNVDVCAAKNINLRIEEGEFVIIFGDSGSGKSTLIHLLGLLDKPTFGNVIIDGKNTSKLDESLKSKIRLGKMGFVFQEYNILPELTVLENVMLPALMTDTSKKEIIKRAKEIIRYIGLEKRANHLPAELSGGERQRVSIARALINNPKMIFADEPTANLDRKHSDNLINLFKYLNQELKITIFLVTHNPKYLKYATKIFLLKDGTIARTYNTKGTRKSESLNILEEYINKAVKKGISTVTLREHLIKNKWPKEIVERAISKHAKNSGA